MTSNHISSSVSSQSRRAFLRRSMRLAFTGTALPTVLNLAALGEAAAFSATDYKALVCVFLYGGNDYANTVVNYDNTHYDLYSAIRGGGAGRTAGGVALAQAALTPTLLAPTTALTGGFQYALNPSMTGLANLFNAGQAAVLLNVGPLIVPLTRAQYNGSDRSTYPLPPKLFSHNDQQSTWQSSAPEGATAGWGGHIGDLAMANNGLSTLTCVSVTGNAVFLSGDQAVQYQVSTSGAVKIHAATDTSVYNSVAAKNAINQLIQQSSAGNWMEDEYAKVVRRSMSAEASVSSALAGFPATDAAFASFPSGNSLADQLKLVARLIAARNTLGIKRQVYFVSMGGFDLHDFLMAQHGPLLGKVSAAMGAFRDSMVALGVNDKVTAFTASDFGRTLSYNGDGSDHGWGSHHFIVGGAVKGAAFYGTPPPVSVGNTSAADDQWHVGQGRLLPSTSVDQYAATLAKWFGVTDAEMGTVMPHLSNFGSSAYPKDLGFMTAT